MQWLTLLSVPVALLACWLYLVQIQDRVFPRLQGKRICLLIAHPDDEAMFFAPTVLALTHARAGNHVQILCLSSGDAYGIGELRKRELSKSGALLGLQRDADISVLEDARFPDSKAAAWDADRIADVLSRAFVRPQGAAAGNDLHPASPPAPGSAAAAAGAATTAAAAVAPSSADDGHAPIAIDVLITFDRHGVSEHPNHCALYHGARRFLERVRRPAGRGLGPSAARPPFAVYTLRSVSTTRKYLTVFDAIGTTLKMLLFEGRTQTPTTTTKQTQTKATKQTQPQTQKQLPSGPLLFISPPADYRIAQRAMTQAHQSQMMWFRWGWIIFGRYMIVNDLDLMEPI
ncbi:MAG: N-acetylglucosaminyl-phosphatidylinositol de-N-acetylase [Phylliscum demangeonii]|nr:MAG: N-acetylglucosaminyl-phosphatidylinositol de-N-acetylase [Phylliscum demangeonii]